eukprot:3045690-Pyramimonas_sp.AAC.1
MDPFSSRGRGVIEIESRSVDREGVCAMPAGKGIAATLVHRRTLQSVLKLRSTIASLECIGPPAPAL